MTNKPFHRVSLHKILRSIALKFVQGVQKYVAMVESKGKILKCNYRYKEFFSGTVTIGDLAVSSSTEVQVGLRVPTPQQRAWLGLMHVLDTIWQALA